MSSFEWMELQTLTKDIELSRSRLADARKSGDRGRVGALEQEIARAEKLRVQLVAHISTNIVSAPEPAKARDGTGSRQAAAPVTEALQGAANGEPPAEPVPAARPKAREGRQASAAVTEAVPDEASEEQPPPELADAAEPAPAAKARDGAGSRQAASPPAEALQEEVDGEQPPPELASAAEPAAHPEATGGAGLRQASAPVAEALPDEADGAQPLPDRVDRVVASSTASPAAAPKTASVEGGITVWDQLKPGDIERAKSELGVRRAEMLARHAAELQGLEAEKSQLETLEQAIDTFLRNFNRSSTERAAAP